jgi:hypothetical protein
VTKIVLSKLLRPTAASVFFVRGDRNDDRPLIRAEEGDEDDDGVVVVVLVLVEDDDDDTTKALIHPHDDVEFLPRFFDDFQPLGSIPLLFKIASTISVRTQT